MTTDPATLTGAYAVNAIAGQERADFELHLATCDDCKHEVAELREVSARLGATVEMTPPDELKRRVLAEVAQTRQQPPLPGGEPQLERPVGGRRSRWGMRVAVAAAMLGVALAGTLGSAVVRGQNELDELRRGMAQASAHNGAMTEVLQAPDVRMISSTGPGEMHATTVLSEEAGKAMFIGNSMGKPPPDRAYQLWFIGQSGKTTSAGLLHGDDTGRTDPIVASMPAETALLGVTVEPSGGSQAPTTRPVMLITMPS